jgi:tryptophan synthase alpha chain
MTTRINETFKNLKQTNSKAFVAYVMGGDPDRVTSQKMLNALPDSGVDIIELGMPFTDPAADGPIIEEAGLRSLEAGTKLSTIFEMASEFRRINTTTPLIIMGYCNPVHHMGYDLFAKKARASGIDGAIIVDLPPEEDKELREAFNLNDLALIRLATPNTNKSRLSRVVSGTKGFVYYVSMTGITGASSDRINSVSEQVNRIRHASNLPVVVGFGVKTPDDAQKIAHDADGVVVGSAIVKELNEKGVEPALELVRALAKAVHT